MTGYRFLHIALFSLCIFCAGSVLGADVDTAVALKRDTTVHFRKDTALFNEEDPLFDETSIMVTLSGIGGKEVPAVVKGDVAYLSVTDMFNFLKIKNDASELMDSVSGFFITENVKFMIDQKHNRVQLQDQTFDLPPDVLQKTETGLYMRTDYFNKIFGLNCQFNFRSLSVNLSTKSELPVMREMRQQLIYSNLRRLKGDVRADTTLARSRDLFKFGMADWSIVSTQRIKNVNDNWLNLTLGGTLLGGEAIVSLNYNNYAQQNTLVHPDSDYIKPFDQRQQFYRLRFVNNDRKWLRQVILGKVFVPTISTLFNPVVGVTVTNTPTTFRRSFGTYTLSNFTAPNWMVELYINDALVDYTQADASGFYTFQVPLVYGNSQIRLRFYGPWGEERFQQENLTIPFNFLPKHEFEYSATAGVVEDTVHSKLGRVQGNYGLTSGITAGGGVEYLSTISNGKTVMPFVTTSIRLAPTLLFAGEYTYGVRARGIMDYRTKSSYQFELDYTKYDKDQKAIIYNWREERKFIVSKPFAGKNFVFFNRLTFDQIILPGSYYTTAEWLASGSIHNIGANLSTYSIFIKDVNPYVYSNLALTFRIPGNVMVTPQVQYSYTDNKPMSIRCDVGKYLFHNGYLNASVEKNYLQNTTNYGIGIRYDFSFTQVGFSVWRNNRMNMIVESARGSLIYDGRDGHTGSANHSVVGTGGVIFIPFLDINNNGRYDSGEPKVAGVQLKNNGGRLVKDDRDTTITVFDLEPFTSYIFEMDSRNLENIAWQIRKPAIKVPIEPNQMRRVEIPVSIMGEVSGKVFTKRDSVLHEESGIKICIYRADSTLVTCFPTESDGYFDYMGLGPGDYVIQPDRAQLKKLHLVSTPAAFDLHISKRKDGDVVDDITFILERKEVVKQTQ
jgi:hypothetical protein